MFHGKRSILGMVAAVGVLMTGAAHAAGAAKAAAGGEVAILETSKGRMVVEFFDKEAPKTAANFRTLAKSGFYDGTGFHRIIKNFMIQGGDPKSKNPKAPDLGTGGSDKVTPDEFNAKKHVKGVISMAHSGPNTARSQFFIMHASAYPSLDGKYTAFGRVVEGMDVLDKIASVPVGMSPQGEQSKPQEWVTLKSVKIVPRASLASAGKAKAGTKTAAKTGVGLTAKPAAAAAKSEAPAKAADATPAADKAAAPTPDAATTAPGSAAPADTAAGK